MFKEKLLMLIILVLCYTLAATKYHEEEEDNTSIPDEKWGYVTVRPKAHMFWWSYGAQSKLKQRSDLPLILWLQGGPGGSGTGFGNFGEIGPLDMSLKPRSTTWLTKANLLFIDNPVGAGFSYVEDSSAFTKNITGITNDLFVIFSNILKQIPAFKKTPFYIFSESYGGKMAAAFGEHLHQAIQRSQIVCNFKGVALGDSWISPIDSVLSWGPYLYQFNMLDEKDLAMVNDAAKKTATAVKQGNFGTATNLWSYTERVIWGRTNKVSFYNVLEPSHSYMDFDYLSEPDESSYYIDSLYQHHVGVYQRQSLADTMDGIIRHKLKVIPANVRWGMQSRSVFRNHANDFMKPVIKTVSNLISHGVKVVVFQGQLDLICDTPAAEEWIRKLNWPHLHEYLATSRRALYVGRDRSKTEAFVKEYENFSLYVILRAGHMVPYDNAPMALEMVDRIVNSK